MDYQPIAVNAKELKSFKQSYPAAEILDTSKEQLQELFFIRNPRYRFDKNYQQPLDEFLAGYPQTKAFRSNRDLVLFPLEQ